MIENRDTLVAIFLILLLGFYLQHGPKIGSFLSSKQIDTFKSDGIVVVENLFSKEELNIVSEQLMSRVYNRPENVRAEDLLNLHLNDSYILELTKHPNSMAAASQLLNYPKLKVFTTRILCKMPGDGESIEIPWHQDSSYWPLWPMKVASLWLALDDITEENGAMEMFTFKYLPQTRDRNLGVKKVEETGADFFIKIEEDVLNNLPMENVVKMTLRRGQSEFHDAHILHRSSENRSSRKRCAWIVRYIPDYVQILPNSWRKMFHDNYPLVKLN